MFRVYAILKITFLASNHDVVAVFKARRPFRDFFCNLFTEKCMNIAFEITDTFDSRLCGFLF